MEQTDLPFGERFKQSWDEWLQYRKEHRFKQYVPTGLKKTFTELINISGNNETTAIRMIERAMANNWQGFNFKLPENGRSNNSGSSKQNSARDRQTTANASLVAKLRNITGAG